MTAEPPEIRSQNWQGAAKAAKSMYTFLVRIFVRKLVTAFFPLALCIFSLLSHAQDEEPAAAAIQNPSFNIEEDFYIFVNKEANSLSLRSLKEPGKVLQTFLAISGLNAGDKVKEGDRKTPEGVYVTTRRVSSSELYPPLHGPAGIALNYPNPVDRINGQTGSGIWIHGVEKDSRLKKRFDTRGCVAVSNADIMELVKWFVPRKTVVVVVDNELQRNSWGLQEAGGPLEKAVLGWAKAWSGQDPEAYISYYHPEFRSRGMNYDQWNRYKTGLKKRYKYIQVDVSDVYTFKHSKYWVTQFVQSYESNMFKSRTLKRLYWVGAENAPKIIAEETLDTVEGPKVSEETPDLQPEALGAESEDKRPSALGADAQKKAAGGTRLEESERAGL